MATKTYGYVRTRFGNDKDKAWLLKEAKRLRKTGRYNAKVLRSRKPHDTYKWTLWTQLTSTRP